MKRVQTWEHLKAITRPALILAPATYLDDIRANFAADGITDAVSRSDTIVTSHSGSYRARDQVKSGRQQGSELTSQKSLRALLAHAVIARPHD